MLDSFSATYAEAREKFLTLARSRDAHIHSVMHPTLGAEGEELAMDFAVFGDRNAERTLLVVSGTHGQEGFFGSAVQVEFLRDLNVPGGMNVVALHALNPWGFSYLSRTDELNIDVNRNFLDFSQPLPSASLYTEVHPMICPDNWSGDRLPAEELVGVLLAKYERQAILNAVTGGQFDVPTGLNFGGRAPAWSNRMVAEHLPPLLASAKKVAFVEWHTGLGRFAELCYVCMHDPGSSASERIWDWMGDEARHTFAAAVGADGRTPSYSGLFCNWAPNAAPHADCAGLVIEVGTYDAPAVWEALRTDRWLKFGRGAASASREDMRRDMLERLYPASEAWRRSALAGGCGVQSRMLGGLSEW